MTLALLRSANDWSLLTASTMLSATACGCSMAGLVSSAIHGFLPVRSSVSPGEKTTWSGCTVTYLTWGVMAPVTLTVPEPEMSAEFAPTPNW